MTYLQNDILDHWRKVLPPREIYFLELLLPDQIKIAENPNSSTIRYNDRLHFGVLFGIMKINNYKNIIDAYFDIWNKLISHFQINPLSSHMWEIVRFIERARVNESWELIDFNIETEWHLSGEPVDYYLQHVYYFRQKYYKKST